MANAHAPPEILPPDLQPQLPIQQQLLDGEANGGSDSGSAAHSEVPSDAATLGSSSSESSDMGVGVMDPSIFGHVHSVKVEIQASMALMKSELLGRFGGIDGRLDGIDGRLNGIDGRLDGIDGRLDGIVARVVLLENAKKAPLKPEGSGGTGPHVMSLTDFSQPPTPQFVYENGLKLARFHFDVSDLNPGDVSVTTADKKIVVTAKHVEDKGKDHEVKRKVRRMLDISEGMQIGEMKWQITPGGVLIIEIPSCGNPAQANAVLP